jgi:hypothetical protein
MTTNNGRIRIAVASNTSIGPARPLSQSMKLLATLSAPWALGCAGASVPVFLPGERVECLFEVIGDVTVRGPFRFDDDIEGGSLQGVRLEVGRQAFESGVDAVMVRELIYERDAAAAGDDAPEISAVEGMLLSFVDPTCVPTP